MDKERRPASNRFQRRVILFTCLLFFHLLAFIFVFSSSLLRQLPPQPDVTLCWFGDDSVYDAGILPRSQERKSPASLVSELGHLTRPTGLQFDGEDALRRVGVLAVGGRHVIQSRFHDDSGTFSVGLEATQASLQYGGSFAAISASEPVWATPEGPQGTRLKHANLVELRGARMSKVWKDYDKGMRKTSAETPAAMCSTWNLVEMETETGTTPGYCVSLSPEVYADAHPGAKSRAVEFGCPSMEVGTSFTATMLKRRMVHDVDAVITSPAGHWLLNDVIAKYQDVDTKVVRVRAVSSPLAAGVAYRSLLRIEADEKGQDRGVSVWRKHESLLGHLVNMWLTGIQKEGSSFMSKIPRVLVDVNLMRSVVDTHTASTLEERGSRVAVGVCISDILKLTASVANMHDAATHAAEVFARKLVHHIEYHKELGATLTVVAAHPDMVNALGLHVAFGAESKRDSASSAADGDLNLLCQQRGREGHHHSLPRGLALLRRVLLHYLCSSDLVLREWNHWGDLTALANETPMTVEESTWTTDCTNSLRSLARSVSVLSLDDYVLLPRHARGLAEAAEDLEWYEQPFLPLDKVETVHQLREGFTSLHDFICPSRLLKRLNEAGPPQKSFSWYHRTPNAPAVEVTACEESWLEFEASNIAPLRSVFLSKRVMRSRTESARGVMSYAHGWQPYTPWGPEVIPQAWRGEVGVSTAQQPWESESFWNTLRRAVFSPGSGLIVRNVDEEEDPNAAVDRAHLLSAQTGGLSMVQVGQKVVPRITEAWAEILNLPRQRSD